MRKILLCIIISVMCMNALMPVCSAEDISLSEAEKDMICRFTDAAVGDAPLAAKLGIVNVVLNRLADSDFPDTVTEVIFLGGFECVEDGRFEKAYLSPLSVSAKDALDLALMGRDPTGGAVYFAEKSRNAEKISISFDAGRFVFGK